MARLINAEALLEKGIDFAKCIPNGGEYADIRNEDVWQALPAHEPWRRAWRAPV
jgi:hypothetical protein